MKHWYNNKAESGWLTDFFRRIPLFAAILLSVTAVNAHSTHAEEEPDLNRDKYAEWASETTDQIGEKFLESICEVDRLREEKLQIWEAICMEMLKGWELTGMVTEDAPWHIRVNQGTNTVTIYRVLQVRKEEIPFYEGYQEIVARAVKKADRIVEERLEDASGSENDETSETLKTGNDEETVTKTLRHIVLREFKQKDVLPASTVAVFVPVYACPCSVGANNGTPDGFFTIQDHLRWHELVGPTWGQWCCHFAPALLFHSLPYDRPNDPNSMQEDVYNLIGTAASHGCVRLAAIDAKYIYDHVPTGGKVEIFTGTAEQDPIGTPERPFVGEWDKSYDPTDPEYKPEE